MSDNVKFFCIYALVGLTAIFALSSPMTAQTMAGMDGRPATETAAAADIGSAEALVGEPTADPLPKSSAQDKPDPDKLKVVIYPIMAWAPILGANVRVGDSPSTPGGGSGSTSDSFNGAAMFGFTVEKAKWYAQGDAMWAGMSASRTSPHVNVDINGVFGGAQLGYKVYRDFYLTGGFRRLAFKYNVTLGNFPQFSREPGDWDPLIGVIWKRQLSKKWTGKVNVQGGGFGVGADVDFSAVGTFDWQFAKHFGLALGYGVLHISQTEDKLGLAKFTIDQTLNGPQFGFGIYF